MNAARGALAVLLLVAWTGSAFAQDELDTVYLKGGGLIRGIVVEDVPGQPLRIRLPDGVIRTLERDRIERVELYGASAAPPSPPAPPPPSPGVSAPNDWEQPPGIEPVVGQKEHRHNGFYLRMNLGPAYALMASADSDVTVRGPGAMVGGAIGGAVTENVILFVDFVGDSAFNPTVESGGQQFGTSDITASVVGFGPGTAYYFMPANAYASASLMVAQLSFERVGVPTDTAVGVGANLMLGKEWWVSNEWGLGVAAQLFAGQIRGGASAVGSWTFLAFGLGFSATYN